MFPDLTPDLLEAPTEPIGGTAAAATTPSASTETPTQTTPAAQPAASTTTPAATGATTTPAAASAPASAPAAVTPATPSWLDSFRKDGFTTQETDEAKVRAQLLQSHRDAERLRPLAPHLSAYQQHATEFQQFLAQRQKAQQTQQPQDWTAALGWNPPGDFEQLRRQVTTDAQGNIVAVPGAAPDAVTRYQATAAYRQEQAEKFLGNPMKYMEPAIRHIAQEIAQKQADQGVGQYREQIEAQSFVKSNSHWLFEQDNGQVRTQQTLNPTTGQYETQQVLSNWGKQFVNHLSDAAKAGLNNEMQQKYALQAIQNAYMATPEYVDYVISQRQATTQQAAQPAAPTQTPRQQSNAAFTARANPATLPAPQTGSGNTVTSPQKVTRENLDKVMLERFRAEGITL